MMTKLNQYGLFAVLNDRVCVCVQTVCVQIVCVQTVCVRLLFRPAVLQRRQRDRDGGRCSEVTPAPLQRGGETNLLS